VAMTEPLAPPLRSTGFIALIALAVYVLLAGLHWWERHSPCGWSAGSFLSLAAFALAWTPLVAGIWLVAVVAVWALRLAHAKTPTKADLLLWVCCGLALFTLYGVERATQALPLWICDPF